MDLFEKIGEKFHLDTIADSIASLVPDLIAAVATVLIYWLVWRAVLLVLKRLARRGDATTHAFVQTAVRVVILTLGLVSGLSKLGVDTGSLLASLGIVGLTIGFAARDALSNIISGILIFWDRPFVLGDLIEVEGAYGRVAKITLRSTRVVTPDGRMLAIPNATIISTSVASYTNFPNLRIDIDVSVGTGTDIGAVRKLLLELIDGDADFLETPAPTVCVTALGDYFVGMQLNAWLQDETKHVAKRLELRERVFETLRQTGVDMPCETLSLNPLEVRQAA